MKTNREFLTAVINASVNDEITEFATAALAKLDATNAKRREATAAKADANQPLIEMLVTFLNGEPQTAADLMAKFVAAGATRPAEKDGTVKDWNVQFASNLARKAVDQGLAKSEEVKIPKHGVQKGYTLAE